MVNKPYPEWLERSDVPASEDPWTVSSGRPNRGEAWTSIKERQMCIPTGDDDASRVIRAHEMVHAKISPQDGVIIPDEWAHLHGVPMSRMLVIACEETRVNYVVNSMPTFDTKHLSDGGEKSWGYKSAETGNTNFITLDVIASFGTGSLNKYISGLRKAVKDGKAHQRIVDHALMVKKELSRTTRYWKRYVNDIPSTVPLEVHVDSVPTVMPDGYIYTLRLAEQMAEWMVSEAAERIKDIGDVPVGPGDGKFATPIVDKLPLTRRVTGRMNRKRLATNVGVNPRRINRMLTDPDRRIFDRRASDIGGVVLIDQSGSMRLSERDVWQIINASPGCVVIGYSHHSGSTNTPNIWVIADRGHVAERVPRGNGGNGVDGPALLYALSKRKGREPFIWVCDGYVTDNADNYRENLGRVCADIVRRNGIHMVEDVDRAVDALKRVARGEKLKTRIVGILNRVTVSAA